MKKLKQKFATILMLASIMTQSVLPVVAFAETVDEAKTEVMTVNDEATESTAETTTDTTQETGGETTKQETSEEIQENNDTVINQETLSNEEDTDLMKWSTGITASVVVDGENYDWSNENEPIEMKQSASFQFTYSFVVPNEVDGVDVNMAEQ